MISDITLGQFFPGFSTIHKLDPRTKLISAILYIVTVFFANNPAGFAVLFVFTLSLIKLSRISFRVIFKGLKPIVFVLIFTAILNIFLTTGNGEAPLFEFYFIKVYTAGIIRAIFMGIRVILLIMGTSVFLTYTTSPIALTDGLESLLSPLKKIKVPVHSFAMMMSIVLRFIPALSEETEKIMTAQKSRGADFESGSLIQRAKALIPILIPLFVSAFRRSDELATAMECRCYHGGDGRTRMTITRMKAIDFVVLALMLVCVVAICLLNVIDFGYVM